MKKVNLVTRKSYSLFWTTTIIILIVFLSTLYSVVHIVHAKLGTLHSIEDLLVETKNME